MSKELNLAGKTLKVDNVEVVGTSNDSLSSIFFSRTITDKKNSARDEFKSRYILKVDGDTSVKDGTVSLYANVYMNGVLVGTPEFSRNYEYTWNRIDNSPSHKKTGKFVEYKQDEIDSDNLEYYLTWQHDSPAIGTVTQVYFFKLSFGEIREFAYSYCETIEEISAIASTIEWKKYSEVVVDDGTEENPYLWRRMSYDGGSSYEYFRETGLKGENPATWYFSAQIPTYRLGDRGYTEDSIVLYSYINRINGYSEDISEFRVLGFDSDSYGSTWYALEEIIDDNGDVCGVSISIGQYVRIPESFHVECEMADGSVLQAFFSCTELPTYSKSYAGSYNSAPTESSNSNGVPYIDGDYALATITDSDGVSRPHPYVFSNGIWREMTSSDEGWQDKVSTMIPDAISSAEYEKDKLTVYELWCAKFFAQDGVINNLFTQYFQLKEGGAIYTDAYDKSGVNESGKDGIFISNEHTEFSGETILKQGGKVLFKTQKKIEGKRYTDSKGITGDRWSVEQFFNRAMLSDSFEQSAFSSSDTRTYQLVPEDVVCDDVTYSRCIYRRNGYFDVPLGEERTEGYTYESDSPATGYLRWQCGYNPFSRIDVNGVTVYSPSGEADHWNTNISINKGDHVLLYAAAWPKTIFSFEFFVSVPLNSQYEYLALLDDDYSINRILSSQTDMFVYSNHLVITSSIGTVYDTDSVTYQYVSGIQIPEDFPPNTRLSNDSWVKFGTDSTQVSVNKAVRNSNSITFYSGTSKRTIEDGMSTSFQYDVTTISQSSGCFIETAFMDNFIGMVQYFLIRESQVPNGWLILNGGYIGKEDYPKFASMIEVAFPEESHILTDNEISTKRIGNPSNGDLANGIYQSENYIMLPDLTDYYDGSCGYFLRGGSGSSIGNFQDDKIRNIKGYVYSDNESASNVGGAFVTEISRQDGWEIGADNNGVYGKYSLNANAGTTATNPMAGHADGEDIHPASLIVLPCIYVGE